MYSPICVANLSLLIIVKQYFLSLCNKDCNHSAYLNLPFVNLLPDSPDSPNQSSGTAWQDGNNYS